MLMYQVKPGETLESIAADFRTTRQALLQANPGLNGGQVSAGQSIIIPGIRNPDTIPYRIAVSLSGRTLRLYEQNRLIKTYPIAVGKILTQTPRGEFVIVNRQPNPGGPFGAYWLSLSKQHYGIHGTNNPASIGKAVSRGCIRMHNRDVLELASIVPNGTRVSITP
ncbi:L,D-transpeptidase family protein [Bacillus haynesii]|uniref:L,D-transpeptidase family protein n=2 Tax=Bacillus haynesii TaxID=1925021 RepID=A0AA90EAG2_9BACI|nr:L,D-transpeptidase family protein [Bacillus haynesii]EWH21522.1 L,D-transpeptidase [Bacillus haynesii]MCI4125863.1 L,D-transpeptidase family protein [Bacillus haynesii]MCY7770623.1 L,D-transpeptidase family protein [Bacillus haynesii]MCY7792634.1 L,D-transpeptidase family protein [Bacillus haynesii]MCY8001390.1 L,D-transpeptidase family protein [Bacillus haynesii]